MDKLIVLFLCFNSGLALIRIKELRVPQSIESGTTDDAILDCDFEAEDEKDIELKWFLNGQIDQIYQWIPETNRSGQAIGKLKDNIDTNYKISNDRNTMYRALRIINITPEMSGNYTCKVSSYHSEDVDTKRMIIYEPALDGLDVVLVEEESEILCEASGLFPKPDMKIYITNHNNTEIIVLQDDEDVIFDEENEWYNVTASLNFTIDNLTNPFTYVCELGIPGTTYLLKESKTHYLEELDDIETQIEEDYVNTLNNSNSIENATSLTPEKTDYETQIEDDFDSTTKIDGDSNREENSSPVGLPNLLLLSTSIIIVLLMKVKA